MLKQKNSVRSRDIRTDIMPNLGNVLGFRIRTAVYSHQFYYFSFLPSLSLSLYLSICLSIFVSYPFSTLPRFVVVTCRCLFFTCTYIPHCSRRKCSQSGEMLEKFAENWKYTDGSCKTSKSFLY